VKFSSSTLREFSDKNSLITEGVTEKPREFSRPPPRFLSQISRLQAGALTNYTTGTGD